MHVCARECAYAYASLLPDRTARLVQVGQAYELPYAELQTFTRQLIKEQRIPLQETERLVETASSTLDLFWPFRGDCHLCGDNRLNLQKLSSASRAELADRSARSGPG